MAQDETDAAARLAEALHEQLGSVVEIDVCESAASALLPVVRELQAEELEAAAAWSTSVPSHMLRARAAALRGEAGR